MTEDWEGCGGAESEVSAGETYVLHQRAWDPIQPHLLMYLLGGADDGPGA